MEVLLPKSCKWTTVPLEGSLKARGFEEGLVGIETVSSYKLITGGDSKKRKYEVNPDEAKTKQGKEKSRKLKNVDFKPENVDKDEKSAPEKKKKTKTRQKRKKKTKKPTKSPEQAAPEEPVKAEKTDDKDDLILKLPSWNGLHVPQPVLRALLELGFTEPTPIQKAILPAAIKGRIDVLGAAETGSGKTLAFGIPMINGILEDLERERQHEEQPAVPAEEEEDGLFDDDEFEDMSDEEAEMGCVKVVKDVEFNFDEEMFAPPLEIVQEFGERKGKAKKRLRGLVLTPTRELAVQVKAHLEAAAKYTGLTVAVVFGGMAPQKQTRILSYGPDIVVATPGRLWDLIQTGDPHLSTVTDIKYLAIDETDRMVEKGHFDELHKLLEMINEDESKKVKRQNFVFSATLSLVHDVPKHMLNKKKHKKKLTPEEKLQEVIALIGVKSKRKIVDLTRKAGTVATLTESRIHADLKEKDFYLYYFTQMHPGRTLVFCNSIDCVRRLVNLFSLLQCSPLGLHAQMHQKLRLKNLERFSADPSSLLIATDVAARGLDIKDVQHVVHYQVPRTSESYVHRSGRTARAFKEGISVMLIDSAENQLYKKMCNTLGRNDDIPLFPVDGGLFSAGKKRVQVARELDKLKLESKKEDVSDSWWKKAAEEADLELTDESDSDDEESKSKKKSTLKMNIQSKQQELASLLSVPLTSQGFSGKYPTKSGRLELPSQFTENKGKSALQALEHDAVRTKQLLKAVRTNKKARSFKKKKRKSKAAS